MSNCDEWYEVDFGRGPVEIRCTKIVPHADNDHECRVAFTGLTGLHHRNVFDKD